MHCKSGCCRAATVLLLCGLTSGLLANASATAEEAVREQMGGHIIDLDPADLAAVSGPTRRLMATLTDHIKLISTEMGALRAGKAALAERVTRLEELDCSRREEEIEAKDETKIPQKPKPAADTATRNSIRHRRAQADPACERVRDFQALTAAAMDACCPVSGGGHRRMQVSCDLPAACPSAACAAVFVPYMADCTAMVAATPGVPVADFQSLAASCEELQVGAGEMLQPVAVQMFRVMVTEGAAHQAGAMFPGGAAGSRWRWARARPSTSTASCASSAPRCCRRRRDRRHAVPCCLHLRRHRELCAGVQRTASRLRALATINGTDTKFSCNLAHGLFSWMGAATEGGFLGADSASFLSAVVSGAAGSYIVTLAADVGISTDLTITPGQTVSVSGAASLAAAPHWGSGFTVQERGSLALNYVAVEGALMVQVRGSLALQASVVSGSVSCTGGALSAQTSSLSSSVTIAGGGSASLSGCTLPASASLTIRGGGSASLSGCTLPASASLTIRDGSLGLSSMDLPAAVLFTAADQLSVAGSRLWLSAVMLSEVPAAGERTGTMTVGVDGSKTIDPLDWGAIDESIPGTFTVLSGPCEISEGGRCVGRPRGYSPDENCAIVVGGGGGVLGACAVFDTFSGDGGPDHLTLPAGSTHSLPDIDAFSHEILGDSHRGSDCPRGAALAPGDALRWESSGNQQGSVGRTDFDNGCAGKGTCGLPYSGYGLGGGWIVCFA